MDKTYSFDEFMDIVKKLRSKDSCPWDREQTHESLKQCLLEECYEVIEAINNKDGANLCEELGDILLQVAMHSAIAEEEKDFTISDVITKESEKMIRRHPHVFGDVKADTAEEVLKNWDAIKDLEKDEKDPKKELEKIPKALPANIRAEKVQKKAVKFGLELGSSSEAINEISERLEKLKDTITTGDNSQILDEYGWLVFNIIKLSLILQINAEYSLTNATNKFINRLIDVLFLSREKGCNLCNLTSAERDALWW